MRTKLKLVMKKLSSIILLFICATSWSQINFEPGYFISNNGEKTECLIKNIAWKNNPTEFEYILAKDETPLVKKIAEVSEFNVGNSYKFKRFTLKIDRSSNNLDNLSKDKNPIWEERTVFLKYIIEGKLNLYEFEDNAASSFFISKENLNPEQLVYKKYRTTNLEVANNNYFRQQLLLVSSAENVTENELRALRYKKSDLAAIILKMNNSGSDISTNYEKSQNKVTKNVKFTLGAFNNSIDFKRLRNNDKVDFGSKVAVTFGLELEYVLAFNHNKWSVFVNPNYNYFKHEDKTSVTPSSSDYKYIEIPFGVRHHFFLNKNSKIFVEGGYSVAINLKSSLTVADTEYEISKSGSLFFGLGYTYDRYTLQARAYLKRGLIDSYGFEATYSSYGLLAGYKFL